MMKFKPLLLLIALASGLMAGPITQIAPTDMASLSAYLSSTTYIDFSNLTDFDWNTFTPVYPANTIHDDDVTLTFAFSFGGDEYPADFVKFTTPNPSYYRWWNSQPYSQRGANESLPLADPMVDNLRIYFSRPLETFGFEAMPYYATEDGEIAATFHGTSDQTTVTYPMRGYTWADSRIFAAEGGPMNYVDIVLTGDVEFALAGFRYELADEAVVPEPSTYLSLGAGLLGLVALRRRFR